MGQSSCKCPEPERSLLPHEVLKAAVLGETEKVTAWLGNGKKVNVATEQGDTLLSTAAKHGRSSLLDALLKFPFIHLNTYHKIDGGGGSYTPLWLASANGHLECVQLLAKSNLQCRVDLIGSKTEDLSAIMIAAERRHWAVVDEFLKIRETLSPEEANYIFPRAARETQWTAGVRALANCSHFDMDTLIQFFQQALAEDEWDVLCAILKVNFRHKSDSINEALSKAVGGRRWDKVTLLMKLLPIQASFDRPLVEAALNELDAEVARQLKDNHFDLATHNGNLMVIAAGGTNDVIAGLVCNLTSYSQYAVESALYLSAMNGRLEFLQQIFAGKPKHKFSYHTLSRAQRAASQGGYVNADRILSKILDTEAELCALNYVKTK
ncbi:uncharacterized protein LOC135201707 [Macrobrachium nipponense]|uniref:uncharacterized protein LOC135201707 n=1 Tax=Macrobrachium nipponense TaxID=159736 RepID=UPI0030C8D090